jgi:hypothetical protein
MPIRSGLRKKSHMFDQNITFTEVVDITFSLFVQVQLNYNVQVQ